VAPNPVTPYQVTPYPVTFYPAGPAWGQPWPVVPRRPQAPGSTAALVTGIVALAGGLVLLLPLVAAPIAWYLGVSACRRSEREPDQWAPTGSARAGMVLGMVGTGILVVVTLLAVVVSTLAWVTISTPSPY
jgi:hypothetical protein